MRILLLLLLPFIGYSQASYNPYSRVLNLGNLYPTAPYQQDFYRSFNDTTMNCVYNRDGNYETAHITGANSKLVSSTQQYLGYPTAWAYGYTGSGVKICVIDGGPNIKTPHKDIEVDSVYEGYGVANEDHGIQMVSIMAARNNGGRGVLGDAYNAGIYVGSKFDVIGSIDWGLSLGCRIFTFAFLDVSPDALTLAAFERIHAANGIAIISAGNNKNTKVTLQPLCVIPNTISVGCTNAGSVREFKDSVYTLNIYPLGRKSLDFAAPSFHVAASKKTTVIGTDYYAIDGGSSSGGADIAPMYALLMERFPTIKVAILTEMLKAHSHVFDNFGVAIRVPKIDWLR